MFNLERREEPKLSQREMEILLLAAEGLTDKEISQELGISTRTTSTYWERMFQKTGATKRTQVIASCLRNELVTRYQSAIEAGQWLELLVQNLQDHAIFSLDVDGIIQSWNKGVERVLGYAESEFIGQNGEIVFTPEDRAAGEPEKELGLAAKDGQAKDERWHQRKDGTRIWVSGEVAALRTGGELRGFAKIMRDNTAMYELRQRVNQLESQLSK